MDLFRDLSIHIEKTAAANTRLSAPPEEWPRTVLEEAFKQLPFLVKYASEVEMKRVDPSRGFGYGTLVAYPLGMTKRASLTNKKFVAVPIVIRNNEMSPMDVYASADSRFHPMDEAAVEQILSSNGVVSRALPTSRIPVRSIMGDVTPPTGSGDLPWGTSISEATQRMPGEFTKMSSYLPWLAKTAGDRIADISQEFAHAGVRAAYATLPALEPFAQAFVAARTQVAASEAEPVADVMLIKEAGSRFHVITASRDAYAPTEAAVLNRFEVQRVFGNSVLEKLAQRGMTLLSSGAGKVKTADAHTEVAPSKPIMLVDTVRSDGSETEGLLFSDVRLLEGSPIEGGLFVDGHGWTLQESIAAYPVHDQVQLPHQEASGPGVFVSEEGWVTEPLVVRGIVKEAGAVTYLTERMTGEVVTLRRGGFSSLTKTASQSFALPVSMKFYPLPSSMMKVAYSDVGLDPVGDTVYSASTAVMRYNGEFSFDKTAATQPFAGGGMSEADAALALAALGLQEEEVFRALATAERTGEVTLLDVVPVSSPLEARARMEKAASEHLPARHAVPRVSTVKEVALIGASLEKTASSIKVVRPILSNDTLDAVLSINFMTPENAEVYVRMLPTLEKAASDMAEVLVASRLGIQDIPEDAAASAVQQVQKVVYGLRSLQAKMSTVA